MHVDRCEAVVKLLRASHEVLGLELFSKSDVYEWQSVAGKTFEKRTLFPGGSFSETGRFALAAKIVAACLRSKVRYVFFCHYDQSAIFLAAVLLRLAGRNVYTMGCSKFDDYERSLWREVFKSFFLLPYMGAISSGRRARDYFRFLGLSARTVVTEYNTLSIERIRLQAGVAAAPGGVPYGARHFTIVARLIEKKNLAMAIDAYSLYRGKAREPRDLHICGSGVLEGELRSQVEALGLSSHIVFEGFVQTSSVSAVLGHTLALILPSKEEQFGNVVIEALAMGVPVILSDNCGARDRLIRVGINGFLIEPDNPRGLSSYMATLSDDIGLWREMSASCGSFAGLADSARFAEAVKELIVQS